MLFANHVQNTVGLLEWNTQMKQLAKTQAIIKTIFKVPIRTKSKELFKNLNFINMYYKILLKMLYSALLEKP